MVGIKALIKQIRHGFPNRGQGIWDGEDGEDGKDGEDVEYLIVRWREIPGCFFTFYVKFSGIINGKNKRP
jgi:hypothetical protein